MLRRTFSVSRMRPMVVEGKHEHEASLADDAVWLRRFGQGIRRSFWQLVAVSLAVLLFVLCTADLAVLFHRELPPVLTRLGLESAGPYDLTQALLSTLPFWLSAIVAATVEGMAPRETDYELRVGLPPSAYKEAKELCPTDDVRWEQIRKAAEATWKYERDRFLRARHDAPLNALIFGLIGTVTLVSCAVFGSLSFEDQPRWIPGLTLSIVAAAGTGFLGNFVRVLARLSGGDITARMFAWCTRSMILVIIADVGLFALFEGDILVTTPLLAVVLGVFAGALGDRAILLFLDKAPEKLFKTASPRPPSSPLVEIEGITDDHVERLKEEGILSAHDLAFVPTARLFFCTAYSLQQICNWQDRALLTVYVGKTCTSTLGEHTQIRGAIDLMALAHHLLLASKGVPEAEPSLDPERDSLRKALKLEDGAFNAFIVSMAHDQATRRLSLYWSSAVASDAEANG